MDISKIIQHQLPTSNYFQETLPKNQIFIHHTAGNSNAIGVIEDWKWRTDKVATAFVIAGNGDIVQAFSSSMWAYHLGLQKSTFSSLGIPYKPLDRTSIAIEVCNWGYLTKAEDGTFRTYVNTKVPIGEVVEIEGGFRGYRYYHKYSDNQLNALEGLLGYLCERYNIPKTFREEMFGISLLVLKGEPGIWGHTSVRSDKTDCSPQPNLVKMLSNLK